MDYKICYVVSSPETDAIAYNSTSLKSIISQIRSRIQNAQRVHGLQKGSVTARLENEHQIFIRAQHRWENSQKDSDSRLNILKARQDGEIYRLKIKVIRYQILDKYGAEIWIKAYQLAKKYQDIPDDLTCDDIQHQIARDLLANKLGYWFSDDMDEWKNIIFDR